ncbi:MAG TPA: undecaprenyl-diphosphate phosphatase [Acidobacteriota bacterium]|nr:undecaprenyl-diphosphate phosphatase [Acidobacteriota bacterium]
MDPLRAVLLGLLQGFTEFLPVSSSGHLALAEALFGDLSETDIYLFFNVMLHVGSLLAVLVFCRRELAMLFRALFRIGRRAETEGQRRDRRLLAAVILATIPTAVIGFAIKLTSMALFSELIFIGFMFFITTAVLAASPRFGGERGEPSPLAAVLIGVAQGVAVMPGLSRSGMTIVSGKAAGMEATAAARFAFVISIPAIFGAALVSGLDVVNLPKFNTSLIFSALYGIMAAVIAGYLSLIWLIRLVRQARLNVFAFYCAAIGIISIVIGLVR